MKPNIFASCIVSILFLPQQTPTVEATEAAYVIAQQSFKSNGVLVVRPDPTDEKILQTIYSNQIHSVTALSLWLEKNIRYQKTPPFTKWPSPLEMLQKRTGDCKGYTLLTAAFLRVLGYQPHFLALLRPGDSHAICTFQDNGVYLWFDNAKLIKTNATSLPMLAEHIANHYNYASLVEFDLYTKTWKVIYKRS